MRSQPMLRLLAVCMHLSRHTLLRLGSRIRRSVFDTRLRFLEILVFVRQFSKPMLDEVRESAENARGAFSDMNINE
jgi:hypothetical protein